MTALRLLIVVGLFAQAGGADRRYNESRYTEESGGNPVLRPCLIKLQGQNEIRIPAQVAGVLTKMPVKEGLHVSQGDLLATIDDREAAANLKIAEYALQSALQRAKEDIEIRYAAAAEAVAEVDLEQDRKANRDLSGAIPAIEIRRKELDWKRASLQIEKAQKDQVLARHEAKIKMAERVR